jgi:hypothetical protein
MLEMEEDNNSETSLRNIYIHENSFTSSIYIFSRSIGLDLKNT